jgi:hypothetical protein
MTSRAGALRAPCIDGNWITRAWSSVCACDQAAINAVLPATMAGTARLA